MRSLTKSFDPIQTQSSERCFVVGARPFAAALAAALVLLVGCRSPRSGSQVQGYFGPTEPLDALARTINANNQQLPTLRGAGHFEAWLREGGRETFVNGELTLLFSRPRSLRLIGKKVGLDPVFDIVTNDDRYWVIVRPPSPDDHTMWWGEHRNLSKIDPRSIPVRPDLVLEVLGILPIDEEFTKMPAPVLRFNNDADAYMLVWVEQRPTRLIAQKEIWYDRATKLPKLVLLFDDDGRIVLRAYLARHRPVEVAGVEQANWPRVATRYDLFFPDTQSKMTLDLSEDLSLKRNGAPNARSFAFPEDPGVAHVKQIDDQARP